MGEGFKDSMPIHLTEGRMPESNSENYPAETCGDQRRSEI